MVAFTLLFGMNACKKEVTGETDTLAASKTSRIKLGEPIVFALTNMPAGATVDWTVSPAGFTRIESLNYKATYYFNKAGEYEVKAGCNGFWARKTVSVMDSVYTGFPPVVWPVSSADQIRLKPGLIDSAGITGLVIAAETQQSYGCANNFLLSSTSQSGSGYQTLFQGVNMPSNCAPGSTSAKGAILLFPVAQGTHQFSVNLNGLSYSGSFVKAGNVYTFTWPYSSGVTISPLIVQ